MITGIVWPMPYRESVPMLDPTLLAALRETKATSIRINADHRNSKIRDVVDQILVAGFSVLPILDLNYQNPNTPAYLDFCERLIEDYKFPMVELLNEPKTMERMTSDDYRRVINAVGSRLQRFRPATRLLIAGDFLRFDRRGPSMDAWLKNVRPHSPGDFDAIAVHPYREPSAPQVTRYLTRANEYEECRKHFYGLPCVVTEVGWSLAGVSEDVQARYVYEELCINKAAGIEATYIYSHISEETSGMGVLAESYRARPVVAAMARFAEEQGA